MINEQIKEIYKSNKENICVNADLMLELFAAQVSKERPQIIITNSLDTFDKRLKNLRFFTDTQGIQIDYMPSDDKSLFNAISSDPAISLKQLGTRFKLALGEMPDVLLISPEALLKKSLSNKKLNEYALLLCQHEHINREELINSLINLGYKKTTEVIEKGSFAVRGSIIDVFVAYKKTPIRIDLFGNEIESIKQFNPTNNRSIKSIESVIIGPAKEVIFDTKNIDRAHEVLTDLADEVNYPTVKLKEKLHDIDNHIYFYGIEKLLPAFYTNRISILESIIELYPKHKRPEIIFEDKALVLRSLSSLEKQFNEAYEKALIRHDLCFKVSDHYESLDEIKDKLKKFKTRNFSKDIKGAQIIDAKNISHIRQDILKETISVDDKETHLLRPLAKKIKELHKDEVSIILLVSSKTHEKELRELLMPLSINLTPIKSFDHLHECPYSKHVHAYTYVCKNPLSFGGQFDFLKLALISEDDIFGARVKRKQQDFKGFKTNLSELNPNDYVVHVDHGIAQFKGLKRLNFAGVESDYILLHYQNEEKLYLPAHKINLIKPYGAIKSSAPRLDKLGQNKWASKKKKVKEAVMAMAQDLLKIYAKRELSYRPAYQPPDAHYHEFEANFEFEPTPDQQRAINDILKDMQKDKPMDRLICGDVGYGKTEVAMRAAMLAVLSKRQVAVLAPTTVIAQQHGLTFKERFKNTGVTIEVISRFLKPKEVKDILKRVANNQIDIIIGTHRLLSADVNIPHLGLTVVDEEQRFGIKSKEHLKKMRARVDVLSMSATPIPRTMQMSFFGIRDLSIIETPPMDRRAILTSIVEYDRAVIAEAINKELERKGQIYFVHNRVSSINTIADQLRDIAPEARIGVAHGQMSETELEKQMLKFMDHELDILVCTTIIETGIDVASANTMFINNAEDFGLSQLYQLRGRIGRSKERAYAYLLVEGSRENLSDVAQKRLEILQKFSDLGAGFKIAQHDLELRGAGDLLGKSQHGHMAAVGYDLYAELLQGAVENLKGKTNDKEIESEVKLPISALIPDNYCPDLHERLRFYERLASASDKKSIENIFDEMSDMLGALPEEVCALKVISLLKLRLKDIYALKLEISKHKDDKRFNVAISLSNATPIDEGKLRKVMESPDEMRITPQQKVIQVLNNREPIIIDALFDVGSRAIEMIKEKLLCD